MSNLVGQRLGNYRLVRLLGQGGFAAVYLGQQIYLGSYAAIKVLSAPLAQEAIAVFVGEARTLVGLTHPHIIRLLDFGVDGSTPFLVMDYAPGGTLRDRYPRGERVALPVVMRYIKQVSAALQHAHDNRLIHRDVKPANLLLGQRDQVLLSDFGISQLAQSSRDQSVQAIAGTVVYMAPEQIQGRPRKASDQYALAVIAYEWLTGTPPFVGSFTEVAAKHCLMPPPPLREKIPSFSAAVERVVMRALAKHPEQRYGSVRAFALALAQAAGTAADEQGSLRGARDRPFTSRRLEDDFEGTSL